MLFVLPHLNNNYEKKLILRLTNSDKNCLIFYLIQLVVMKEANV